MAFRKLHVVLVALPVLGLVAAGLEDGKKRAEDFGEEFHNWHHNDPSSDKISGVSTKQAYDSFVNGKAPKKKIVVAVIDGGVDPLHEDLKDRMWINSDEVDGNGVDDDNNGYIDDIYGWNFLGNKDGKNLNHETLEFTRIYRRLKPKYSGKSAADFSGEEKETYALYEECKDKLFAEREDARDNLESMRDILKFLNTIDPVIEKLHGSSDYTIEDVKKLKSSDKQVKGLIKTKYKLMELGITADEIEKAEEHFQESLDYNLNKSFDPRSEIIGDDITDINDKEYGNPDVKGEDAFHGTFVAGLIGATRANGLGIDGIADHVEIMALRAIPNGDEYDKDVALAIRYAVDNGAHLINMSFGKMYSPQKHLVDDALKYAEEKGVLIVNAAGNDHTNVDKDYHYPIDRIAEGDTVNNMLTVGASSMSTKKDITGSFSNYGKKNVDLFAPGVEMVSLAPDNLYDKGDGTSFASPVACGVAALIWSYFPDLSAQELKAILMESVHDISSKKVYLPTDIAKKPKVTLGDLCVTGGIVNVYNAFELASKR